MELKQIKKGEIFASRMELKQIKKGEIFASSKRKVKR